MGWLTINGQKVELNDEKSVLEVVRKAGIELPTLCYHPELTISGACRLCLVEIENWGILAACHTPPEPGMNIKTNTQILRRLRKMAVELMLARHELECTVCARTGRCTLQDLAQRLGVNELRLESGRNGKLPLDTGSILIRDQNKCILCGECVRICGEVQSIRVYDFVKRGAEMVVDTAFGSSLDKTDCVYCGQCAAICPTGALVINSQVNQGWDALNDPEKTVVFQIAPAVRVSIGEEFNLPPGQSVLGQLIAALKSLGAAKVFDTGFAVDITVIEEAKEFIGRVEADEKIPQFTSCCPAWVKFAEQFYPEYLNNLSSCRSPQQMLGSLIKKYYAQELGKTPEEIFVISVMPCTAKKYEAARPEFTTAGSPDVDLVLTTQELAAMIKEAGIDFAALPDLPSDQPFGFATGAGIIFGVTGGVSEAVLRLACEELTGAKLEDPVFAEVRGYSGVRSCELALENGILRLGIVNGLHNARKLLADLKDGKVHFDLVEVMACPRRLYWRWRATNYFCRRSDQAKAGSRFIPPGSGGNS